MFMIYDFLVDTQFGGDRYCEANGDLFLIYEVFGQTTPRIIFLVALLPVASVGVVELLNRTFRGLTIPGKRLLSPTASHLMRRLSFPRV